MQTRTRHGAALLVTLLLGSTGFLGSTGAAQSTFVLGGPAASLTSGSSYWSWSGGTAMSAFRSAIEDDQNFGPGGTVPTDIDTRDLGRIDAGALSKLDGFIAPWWADTDMPPGAGEYIVGFFRRGGHLVLYNDDPGHDKIGELLGIPTLSSVGTVSNGSQPLFAGYFGAAVNVKQSGLTGQLAAADVTRTNGTVAATNTNGQITAAFWRRGAYAPGAGSMLIVADVDMVATYYGTASYSPLNDNGIFALNGIGFLVDGLCPGIWTRYGAPGCAGSGGITPVLDIRGCPQFGTTVELQGSMGLGGAPGFLVLGLGGRASLPLAGCPVLAAAPYLVVPIALGGTPGEAGTGSLSVPIPIPTLVPPYLRFNAQMLFFDLGATGAFSGTSGIEVTIGG